MLARVLRGAAAGAAGTTALNATTYLDMALRGRGASDTPEQTVEAGVRALHAEVPGSGETREHRVSGLGALTGIASGVGVGAVHGALDAIGFRPPVWLASLIGGGGALLLTNAGMAAADVTHPTQWDAQSWVSDVVPHLAYGVVMAATYEATKG